MEQKNGASSVSISLDSVTRKPFLFWEIAHILLAESRHDDLYALLASDWSSCAEGPDCLERAGAFARALFLVDEHRALQEMSEAFDPVRHAPYFAALVDFSFKIIQGRRCAVWCAHQNLLPKGIGAWLRAALNQNIELAKALHDLSKEEAETLFADQTGKFSRDGFAALSAAAPELLSFGSLRMALESRAPEDALLYLMWKLETLFEKAELRYPEGSESVGAEFLSLCLRNGYFSCAKKLIEWNSALAFERPSAKQMPPLWDQDTQDIRLEGNSFLPISEWAALFLSEPLARECKSAGSPAPAGAKLAAMISAFSKIRAGRNFPDSQAWAHARIQAAEALLRKVWGA